MQQLVIKLGVSPTSPVPWLLYDSQADEIIASGEISDQSQLDSLTEKADNSEVIVLISACNALVSSVTLPEKFNRKLLNALQYMLEDKLAFDVDSQFIAKGKIENNLLPVVVIDSEYLLSIKQALKEADIFCQKIYVDATLLPNPEEGHAASIVQVGDEVLIKESEHSAFAGEAAWLSSLIRDKYAEQTLKAYCEVEMQHEGVEFEYNYDKLPLDLLRSNISADNINLLQGPFAEKDRTNPLWEKWKVAAILAVIALMVDIGVRSVELNHVKKQRDALDQEIVQLVKDGFPEIQRVRKATLKRMISQEMQRLEATGGNASMLALLSQLGDAFSATGVSPQSINFNAERSELRMQSVAKNFDAFEQFKRQITELGLEVEQGAINNRGDEVVGILVVKG